MKIGNQFILSLCFIIFLSCKKDDNFLNTPDFKEYELRPNSTLCQAKKCVPGVGCVNWKSNAHAVYSISSAEKFKNHFHMGFGNVEINVIGQDTEYYNREGITISSKPIIGKFYIPSWKFNVDTISAGYERNAGDGDVLDQSWHIDSTKTSWVQIDNIDTVARKFSGSFQLYFITTQFKSQPGRYSDKYSFTDGKFEGDISFH